jgi:hypothetical protein
MVEPPASDAVAVSELQEVLDRLRALRARLAALQEATVASR